MADIVTRSPNVWKNPWKSEIVSLIRSSRSSAMRGLVGGADLYVWDARDLEHKEALDKLSSELPRFVSPDLLPDGSIDPSYVLIVSLEEHSKWFGSYSQYLSVIKYEGSPPLYCSGNPPPHIVKYLTRG